MRSFDDDVVPALCLWQYYVVNVEAAVAEFVQKVVAPRRPFCVSIGMTLSQNPRKQRLLCISYFLHRGSHALTCVRPKCAAFLISSLCLSILMSRSPYDVSILMHLFPYVFSNRIIPVLTIHAPLVQIATRSPGDLPSELMHLPDDKRFAHRLHELDKAVRQNDGQRWLKVDIDAAVALFYVRHNGGMQSVDTAG